MLLLGLLWCVGVHFYRSGFVCLFVLLIYVLVKSYGHVVTVISPNHTLLPGQA